MMAPTEGVDTERRGDVSNERYDRLLQVIGGGIVGNTYAWETITSSSAGHNLEGVSIYLGDIVVHATLIIV